MDRRGFIQSFIGAAVLAAVPGERRPGLREARIRGSDLAHGVGLDEISGEVGFGMTPIKMEGTSIAYDPGLHLKEGLNKMFGDEYEKLKLDEPDKEA